MKRILLLAMVGLGVFATGAASHADDSDKTVTVGFQLVYNPWKVAITSGAFAGNTSRSIAWRQFDSGAQVINAMAQGETQIAMAGSSPIAAGISRGLDIELFWIVEDIASAEALVARDGSGIAAPQDLVGKIVAAPFASTTHFHLLFALEQFGIDPRDVTIRDLQPPEELAALDRDRRLQGEKAKSPPGFGSQLVEAVFPIDGQHADGRRDGQLLPRPPPGEQQPQGRHRERVQRPAYRSAQHRPPAVVRRRPAGWRVRSAGHTGPEVGVDPANRARPGDAHRSPRPSGQAGVPPRPVAGQAGVVSNASRRRSAAA